MQNIQFGLLQDVCFNIIIHWINDQKIKVLNGIVPLGMVEINVDDAKNFVLKMEKK
jgi:hypothetical protein